MNFESISATDLAQRWQKGEAVDLIDVRTPVEFRELHATPARNLPLDRLQSQQFAHASPTQPVYLICRSGSRAKQACEQLVSAGVPGVVHVTGGTLAWEQAGLPVVRGQKAISLDRQVRIAAGSLVLMGVGLGFLIHPYFVGLAGFIGAGLVFSGVTDTCGMGMVLAKMPWNQVRADAAGCCAYSVTATNPTGSTDTANSTTCPTTAIDSKPAPVQV